MFSFWDFLGKSIIHISSIFLSHSCQKYIYLKKKFDELKINKKINKKRYNHNIFITLS